MTDLQAFARSQVQKTNPNPYDQILLVSQASLNDALENMYLLAPTDSLLLRFSLTLRDGQSLNANLGTPRVSLQVTSQDPQLYYFMKMNSGTMKVFVSQKASDITMKTFDVSGWEIAFPVKICTRFPLSRSPFLPIPFCNQYNNLILHYSAKDSEERRHGIRSLCKQSRIQKRRLFYCDALHRCFM